MGCDATRRLNGFRPMSVPVQNAVGLSLAHDITEVRPGEYKGPAFRRGHKVTEGDVSHLMRLGKRNLYVLNLEADQVHEDEAVLEMAQALAGPGVTYGGVPKEGKLQLTATYDGLLKIKTGPLVEFNLIPEMMCGSLHNNLPVRKGENLAGTRAIPLIVPRRVLDEAVDLARRHYPIFAVKAYNPVRAGLVITGSEVYEGLIEDKFEGIVRGKLEEYGAELAEVVILPDDQEMIGAQIRRFLDDGLDMIVTTGGMSVDPDDVTRLGVKDAGITEFYYGAAVLPGAMFLLAYRGDQPIVGIPACGLYHRATVFDLMLPRLLAGEKPNDRDLAELAVGGLCRNCSPCRFPDCSFGK